MFCLAFALRLLFGLVVADTYDPDEFVLLALSHSVAHGAIPYRDFTFFHPPGILALLRLVDPLTGLWWPLARLISALVDSVTAVIVWRLGLQLYGRREALAAGVLYGANPLTLISGVRIEQDPLVTMLGTAGLALVVLRPSKRAALLGGGLLAAAFWIKYPALILLPVYVIAAPRRVLFVLMGFLTGATVLFLPFLAEPHLLYTQTIQWQIAHRVPNRLEWRLEKVGVFWLLVNPFAVAAVVSRRRRYPLWLLTGFGTGAVYLLASQVYYHYYVPVVPFAALLGAPLAARLRLRPPLILIAVLAITLAWGIDIDTNSPGRQFVSATRFSEHHATFLFIERHTRKSDRILADRFEYAYLSGRVWAPYFWNMSGIVEVGSLKTMLRHVRLIIRSRHAGGSTYPAGFVRYLDSRFPRYKTGATIIWVSDCRCHGRRHPASLALR